MQTGTKISGAVHGAVVLAAFFGGPFFRSDRTEAIQVTEVSVISHSEFLALAVPAPEPIESLDPVDEPVLPKPELQEPEPVAVAARPEPEQPEDLLPIPGSEPELIPVTTAEPPVDDDPKPDTTVEAAAETETSPVEPDPVADPGVTRVADPIPGVPDREDPLPETETAIASQADPPAQPSAVLPRRMPVLDPEPVREPEQEPGEMVVAALLEDLDQDQVPPPQPVHDPAAQPPTTTPLLLTAEESEGLRLAIKECWSVPVGIQDDSELKVTLLVELDRDGKVKGSPRLIEPDSIETSGIRQAFNAARRAVVRCDPYDLPADKYEHWKSMEVVFNPERMVFR